MNCTRGAPVQPWCTRGCGYDCEVMNRDDTTSQQWTAQRTATERVAGVAVLFEAGVPCLRVAPVTAKPTAVGRGTAADLFVDDPALSRIHCEISFDGRAYTIVDKSKHGCFVDGRRVVGRTTVPTFRALRLGNSILAGETDVASLLGEKVDDRKGFIVGPRLRWAEQEIITAAKSGADILVTGETGTGKEWAAKTFHQAGPHAGGDCVTVNCAALPANLIESELFGFKKGAFSGADKERIGLFEAANRGTIFLDEIGEMPIELQPKLLRVLQERAVRRIGDAHERPIDVRFIAATNRDLEDALAAGKFRSDLYYRIARTTVHLPAFRDRIEDLAFHVTRELATQGAPPPAASLIEAVLLREWEGNARELSAAIAKAGRTAQASKAAAGSELRVDETHLSPSQALRFGIAVPVAESTTTASEPLTEAAVRSALELHENNVSAAAQALGVHRNTVHRYIARFGIRVS
jgi:transcriptional regulator with GAF, ATPase, and Fis domain